MRYSRHQLLLESSLTPPCSPSSPHPLPFSVPLSVSFCSASFSLPSSSHLLNRLLCPLCLLLLSSPPFLWLFSRKFCQNLSTLSSQPEETQALQPRLQRGSNIFTCLRGMSPVWSLWGQGRLAFSKTTQPISRNSAPPCPPPPHAVLNQQ